MQSLIKAPVSIRTYAYDQDVSKTLQSELQQYPHAKTAPYLDDAIYSGRQISNEITIAINMGKKNVMIMSL